MEGKCNGPRYSSWLPVFTSSWGKKVWHGQDLGQDEGTRCVPDLWSTVHCGMEVQSNSGSGILQHKGGKCQLEIELKADDGKPVAAESRYMLVQSRLALAVCPTGHLGNVKQIFALSRTARVAGRLVRRKVPGLRLTARVAGRLVRRKVPRLCLPKSFFLGRDHQTRGVRSKGHSHQCSQAIKSFCDRMKGQVGTLGRVLIPPMGDRGVCESRSASASPGCSRGCHGSASANSEGHNSASWIQSPAYCPMGHSMSWPSCGVSMRSPLQTKTVAICVSV